MRGHRFSRDNMLMSTPIELNARTRSSALNNRSPPTSPRSSVAPPVIAVPTGPPPSGAPRVYVLDPGSGETCKALRASMHIHLAVGPEYDVQVKRYPPNWRSMVGVKLTQAEAEADAKQVETGVRSAWPSVHDLCGSAHPRNLATWASTLFDAEASCLRAVDLSATGTDRTGARRVQASAMATASFGCIVCGSRGGEVTLPALWLLGCRLPSLVINGGCAREKAAWLWPAGVCVVLLTGGRDKINNEYHGQQGGDEAYIESLWRAIPPPNRPTTAILHLPLMGHRPDAETLHAVLPPLVAYVTAGLAHEAKPTADSLGGVLPSLLFTADCPDGEWLIPLEPLSRPMRLFHNMECE